MDEEQKRRQRGLPVLSSEADNRAARAVRVVVNFEYLVLLPLPELNLFANVAPLWHPTAGLNPPDHAIAASLRLGLLYNSQGLSPRAACLDAVAAACGVYRDWLVSRSLVASEAAARVSASRIFSSP